MGGFAQKRRAGGDVAGYRFDHPVEVSGRDAKAGVGLGSICQPSGVSRGAGELRLRAKTLGKRFGDIDPSPFIPGVPGHEDLRLQDMADAKALGVRKTPGFFVNGKPLVTLVSQGAD